MRNIIINVFNQRLIGIKVSSESSYSYASKMKHYETLTLQKLLTKFQLSLFNYLRSRSFIFITSMLIVIMRNHKRIDWSQPLRKINSKKEFEQIEAQADICKSIKTKDVKRNKEERNQKMLVPAIETVNELNQNKRITKIAPNYIRRNPRLDISYKQIYQLTQVDCMFVNFYVNRFYFKDQNILTEDLLKKCIVELQLKTGKNMIFTENKEWLTIFLEKEHKQFVQMDWFNQLCEVIYNYWKGRRNEFNYPLLRQLWRPNFGQCNYRIAYHPREKEKRNSRRSHRNDQRKITKQLSQEFYLASKIVDSVQIREDLKLKKVSTQLSYFYQQCSSLVSLPEYLQEMKRQDSLLFQDNYKYFTNKRLMSFRFKDMLAHNQERINQQQQIILQQ